MSTPRSALRQLETSPNPEQPGDTPDPGSNQSEAENGQRALLNILEDFAAEKSGLESGQRAMLNILEDFDAARARMEGVQGAVLNILEDFSEDKSQLETAQRSVLNILEDFSDEKARLEGAQRAALNILEDFSEEKANLQETQRAALNILEDFEAEKIKVELANQQLESEVEERKRAEEKLQRVNRDLVAANKELEAFSYSVSHDLRAPLRSIDGFSLALLEDCTDKLDDQGKNYLRRVRAATQRMGQLIDDLLNLSRMTRAPIHPESVDLSALARPITAELQRTEPARVVEFKIEEGVKAVGDGRLLRIVLENLLGNAWKFTSKRATARIEFGKSRQNGASVYFVRDNGAGFDPAFADRLFGAFQRLHAVSEFPGTGVGLAIVQRIVQRQGGRVWAEGVLDQGATIYFTLAEAPS